MLKAKVVLKQAQMDRLKAGKPVLIRLRDTELEISYNNLFDVLEKFMRAVGGQMRHKGYIRETFAGGLTECLPFDYSHYGEASTAYTPAAGMHEFTALYLMNRWNRTSPNYKFYLGDGE